MTSVQLNSFKICYQKLIQNLLPICLDMSVFSLRGVCFSLYSFILICVYEITYINANNVNPDQMPLLIAAVQAMVNDLFRPWLMTCSSHG